MPGVKIGQGKFGPIDLVIYQSQLCALKRIPKATIDKAKRIEHLKNEKKINQLIRQIGLPQPTQQQQNLFGISSPPTIDHPT